MTMSPLALQAKRVIEAAWLHGAAYDLASQAAFALESAQLLQSPETAAEGALSADAVRVAEDSVVELRREHEENARLRARIAELEAERERWRRTTYRLAGDAGLVPKEPPAAPASARDVPDGEHYAAVHRSYRTPHDLPPLAGERP